MTLVAVAQTIQPASLERAQLTPSFSAKDVYGNEISDTLLKGKKTYLSFQRNAGCPICNLYVHNLLKQKQQLAQKGIDVILVYESSKDNLRKYLEGESFPFSFVADPKDELYKTFGVEKSMGKVMKGMFHGAMGKISKGKKLFHEKIAMDGDNTTIEAGFLIGPDKRIIKAYYGKYVGDQLSVQEIVATFE